MAAATTVFETLSVGDHVIAPEEMYWTIRLWLQTQEARGRLTLDLVPNGDLDALRQRIRPGLTKIVWVETPSNPTCAITDMAGVVDIAHTAGTRVVVDGTLATPVLSRPLELGADLVMHSATKQLNGHSDVLAGALVTAADHDMWAAIKNDRACRGTVLGPFEAWLLLRGMRTLFLRVTKASENAQRVAEELTTQQHVITVMYPGLVGHPRHDVAAAQMHGGFGPLVSFRVANEDVAKRVVAALRLFRNATSLGGVESLVEHRAPVEGQGTPVPSDLIRLSLGIEDVDDLVADLKQALQHSL
jgi:cystathionine gamma-synthase